MNAFRCVQKKKQQHFNESQFIDAQYFKCQIHIQQCECFVLFCHNNISFFHIPCNMYFSAYVLMMSTQMLYNDDLSISKGCFYSSYYLFCYNSVCYTNMTLYHCRALVWLYSKHIQYGDSE